VCGGGIWGVQVCLGGGGRWLGGGTVLSIAKGDLIPSGLSSSLGIDSARECGGCGGCYLTRSGAWPLLEGGGGSGKGLCVAVWGCAYDYCGR